MLHIKPRYFADLENFSKSKPCLLDYNFEFYIFKSKGK